MVWAQSDKTGNLELVECLLFHNINEVEVIGTRRVIILQEADGIGRDVTVNTSGAIVQTLVTTSTICITRFFIEPFVFWSWAGLATLRHDEEPVRAGIENNVETLLVGANVHLGEELDIVEVIKVLLDDMSVVRDHRIPLILLVELIGIDHVLEVIHGHSFQLLHLVIRDL